MQALSDGVMSTVHPLHGAGDCSEDRRSLLGARPLTALGEGASAACSGEVPPSLPLEEVGGRGGAFHSHSSGCLGFPREAEMTTLVIQGSLEGQLTAAGC